MHLLDPLKWYRPVTLYASCALNEVMTLLFDYVLSLYSESNEHYLLLNFLFHVPRLPNYMYERVLWQSPVL